jgi:hypothetical protein
VYKYERHSCDNGPACELGPSQGVLIGVPVDHIDTVFQSEIDRFFPAGSWPVEAEVILGAKLLTIVSNYSYLEKGDISFLVFWKNCVVDLVYKNFIDNYQRTLQNPSLINSNFERKLTYYH